MISPSIPPPRPAGVEEGGGGEEGRAGGLSWFIHSLRLISSSFLVSDFRISIGYISPKVLLSTCFLCGVLCERKISDWSFFYFVPPTLCLFFLHAFGIHLPQWLSQMDVIQILRC
ncbi:hypothetical protein B9Z19DRAFT_1093804 [Tuber borchii]|uniref:Uncharacterized protein n=1 Tax=Tuber borchii TaxID=42251 RepID=A0A2T6ZEZ0_TUBBO|nr:hypothetical protein B9Z19DRAFT_1093804 [Tuber borchii]